MKHQKRLRKILPYGAITVAPLAVLAAVACSSTKESLVVNLGESDFDVFKNANNDNGTIRLKESATLDSKVEIRYAVGFSTLPQSDSSFKEGPINTLKSGDIVWPRAFVKSQYADKYDIGQQNVIKITVRLGTHTELNDTLKASDFEVSGAALSGTINYKNSASLDAPLEVRYYKGMSAPSSDSAFSVTSPRNLQNGDRIFAKLFVKTTFQDQYVINAAAVMINVSNLTKLNLTSTLTSSNFEVTGTASAGTINLKDDAPAVDDKLEIRYFKGSTAPSNFSQYSATAPSDLVESDKVWVKLFVKAESEPNYTINFAAFAVDVQSARTPLNDTISASDFEIKGTAGNAYFQLKSSKTIDSRLEVRYYKGASAPTSVNQYVEWINDLVNDDKIQARLFVREEYSSSFTVSSAVVELTASNLTELVAYSISASDFSLSGGATQAVINFERTDFPSSLELRYAKAVTRPDDASFSTTAPTGLRNNERVWIKLAVKASEAATKSVRNIVVVKEIQNLALATIGPSDWKPDSLRFTGSDTQGLAITDAVNFQFQPRYARGETQPTDDAAYKRTLNDLTSGERVWVKLFTADPANYRVSSTPLSKVVSLTGKVLSDRLELNELRLTGTPGQGKLELRPGVNISDKLEVRYAKSGTMPVSDSAYSDTIDNLANGETVWIKTFVKSTEPTYTINSAARSLRVYFELTEGHFSGIGTIGDIILVDTMTTIPARAFQGTTINANFVLPSETLVIGEAAFERANIAGAFNLFSQSQKITTLKKLAFSNANNTNVDAKYLPSNFALPQSITTIETTGAANAMFENRTLNDGFDLPTSFTTLKRMILNGAFVPLGFVLPSRITKLETDALKDVVLPTSSAWYDDKGIRQVVILTNKVGELYVGRL